VTVVYYLEDEGMEIFIFGEVKVDTIKGSGTFSIGKTSLKDFYSLTKSNNVAQVSGNENDFCIKSIDSPIYDTDCLDAFIDD
jgi:hypothetical protein